MNTVQCKQTLGPTFCPAAAAAREKRRRVSLLGFIGRGLVVTAYISTHLLTLPALSGNSSISRIYSRLDVGLMDTNGITLYRAETSAVIRIFACEPLCFCCCYCARRLCPYAGPEAIVRQSLEGFTFLGGFLLVAGEANCIN